MWERLRLRRDDSRRHIAEYAGAALTFAALLSVYVLLVSPQREFPLNDDWAYTQTVRYLRTTGQLKLSDWTATTLIFQAYWGALFANLLGGLSFSAVRWSTLTFSIISCMALYDLFRQLDLSAPAALLGTLALAVNPVFIYLSYTFMSDVFYLGLMLLSLSCYLRGFKHNAGWALLVGSMLAGAAYLARQLGALLPVAVAAALVLRDRQIRWKPLLLIGVAPGLVVVGHMLWMQFIHGVPWGLESNAVQNSLVVLLRPTAPLYILLRVMNSLLYLGVFSLPALLAQAVRFDLDRDRLIRLGKLYGIWLTMLGILVVFMTVVVGKSMPYLANVFNREGIGALSLGGRKLPVTPGWVFWLVTVIAPFDGAAQGALWTDALVNLFRERAGPFAILLIASVLMAILTLLIVYLWDEYLIVFIPCSLYLVLRLPTLPSPHGGRSAVGGALALAVCGAMMAYTLIEMDDHMAWNAARWTAGKRLVALGILPEAIDGGFEWNGWYTFETALPRARALGKGDDLWAWMSLTPKQYRLTFAPIEGYTVVDQVVYHTPWLGRSGQIYILKPVLP